MINPDGCTYSYAVRIDAASEGSTSIHSRAGSRVLEEPGRSRAAEGNSVTGGACNSQGSGGESGSVQNSRAPLSRIRQETASSQQGPTVIKNYSDRSGGRFHRIAGWQAA